MRSYLLVRSAPRLLRTIAALLLLVTLTGALGRGIEPGLAAHCADHSAASSHRHAPHSAHRAGTLPGALVSAVATTGHACTHCPPADCSSRVPCASETAGQSLRAALPAMHEPPALAVATHEADRRAASTVFQPPTPPPQVRS